MLASLIPSCTLFAPSALLQTYLLCGARPLGVRQKKMGSEGTDGPVY